MDHSNGGRACNIRHAFAVAKTGQYQPSSCMIRAVPETRIELPGVGHGPTLVADAQVALVRDFLREGLRDR